MRAYLYHGGGQKWYQARMDAMINGYRIPTDQCSAIEREVRMTETIVALEISYNGSIDLGGYHTDIFPVELAFLNSLFNSAFLYALSLLTCWDFQPLKM